ncbi:cytochrome-ba3 oxidase subunit [Natrinema salsiterrestre]|uniref:Cytochrome-ba3 oxidase subunit n=1 Tax=Natrinema salsiterrestre TaxID=2950540 RepID=A0A9Q4L0I2_9EURY|nr:cytochrome-ba3 oxidase subunit [Natrinema salsiterrestre]MDF9745776.1 cytochrome-ba3 oxidase subunit [Natrinema salsiterrestre]
MTLESVTPRHAAAVGLLAFVPVLVYGITHSALAGIVSGINLVIIFASLYIATTPVEGGHGHGHPGDGNGTAS